MAEDISDLKEMEQQSIQTNNSWVGGAALIGIGLLFLLNNLNIFHLNNWWALFILIPVVINFSTAWNSYRQHGRLTHKARGNITGGFILALVAGAFLFGWSWAILWPVFLIIGGLSAIINNR